MARKAKDWRNLLTEDQLRYIESCISLKNAYNKGAVHKVSAAVDTVVDLVDILDGKLVAPKAETEELVIELPDTGSKLVEIGGDVFNVEAIVDDFNEQLGLDDDSDSGSDNGG